MGRALIPDSMPGEEDTYIPDTEESAIQDFVLILKEHQKNCEDNNKYVEAEIAAKRIQELTAHEEERAKEGMKSRQIAEKLGIEEAHMLEFQQFNSMWDEKMKEFDHHAAALKEAMLERHAVDRRNVLQALNTSAQYKPKFSKELLNLRTIQACLAKQKDYGEAHKIKVKADHLEAWELEKLREQRQVKIANADAKLQQKQQQELSALEQRIIGGREELKKKRHRDLEVLLQRYQNAKSGLDFSQRMEYIRLQKQLAPAALDASQSEL